MSGDHDYQSLESVCPRVEASSCKCVDWYSEGQARTVEVDGVEVTIRFVGRKGRRARISIVAPAGAVFRCLVQVNLRDR